MKCRVNKTAATAMKAMLVPVVLLNAAFFDPFADRVDEGNSQYNNGRFSDAEKSYKDAENYLPSKELSPDLSFNKGDARFRAGDYDGAIDYYKAALGSQNRDVQKKALFNMGNAFVQKGDKPSAADAYLSALRIDPSYQNAKKNLEMLYRKDQNKKDNDKDKNRKGDGKDKSGSDKSKNDQNGKNSKGGQGQTMNGDQIKNLLQMMKDKPVRRQKKDDGKGLFGGGHEKPW